VRPAKGRPHALRVIRDLVAFTPRGRGTNLGEALSYAAKLPKHHAIVAVLSDFRAEGWEVPLAQLAARHDVVAITIDDPRERHLPDAGWVDMEDAETGQRILVVLSVVASWRRGTAQTATWSASPPGPTVGDTIWLERAIAVPTGWQVRAGKLDATEGVEPLADPAVLRSAGGWVVRYAVVAWKPGVHKLGLPPLWLLGPDGRADSTAGGTTSLSVASVIPDSLLRPSPQGLLAPLRAAHRDPLPPLAALALAAGLLATGVV